MCVWLVNSRMVASQMQTLDSYKLAQHCCLCWYISEIKISNLFNTFPVTVSWWWCFLEWWLMGGRKWAIWHNIKCLKVSDALIVSLEFELYTLTHNCLITGSLFHDSRINTCEDRLKALQMESLTSIQDQCSGNLLHAYRAGRSGCIFISDEWRRAVTR